MDVKAALESTGAILHGHFLLSSGRHSDVYFEKFRLLERPSVLGPLAESLADRFRKAAPEYVVGPTLGGVLVAYEVARALVVPALYLESEDGRRAFRRGAFLPSGARVLLVDDVLTTGLSVQECFPALAEASLVGIGVLVSRSQDSVDWATRIETLLQIQASSWPADDCPLCARGEAITERGSRSARR